VGIDQHPGIHPKPLMRLPLAAWQKCQKNQNYFLALVLNKG
jgi:hypothetical protein